MNDTRLCIMKDFSAGSSTNDSGVILRDGGPGADPGLGLCLTERLATTFGRQKCSILATQKLILVLSHPSSAYTTPRRRFFTFVCLIRAYGEGT